MLPLETLQKYGLKTDIANIKERMRTNDYWTAAFNEAWRTHEMTVDDIAVEIACADFDLLCELAESGERLETPKTIYGYDTQDLIITSQILRLNGITPEMLKDTFAFARRCIDETKRAMDLALSSVLKGESK